MKMFRLMDSLLRDRNAFYSQMAEQRDLGVLCKRLVLIFLLTTVAYGAVMGSYRAFHPTFFFSDFQVAPQGAPKIVGKVVGINVEKRRIYVNSPVLALRNEEVRFNVTQPTDPFKIEETGKEGAYEYMQLTSSMPLEEPSSWMQCFLTALKVPALFLLSLLVCALALYLMNLFFGLGLHFTPAVTLMFFGLAATGVMLGVFAPIALLFSVVTENYHFIKVMHLGIFFFAGLVGVVMLREGLTRLAPDGFGSRIKVHAMLFSWLMLYCLVGGQIAWTLKPFLGTPYLPATPPFRLESGNIYVSFLESLMRLGS
jgi:hypothetical protein